MTCYHLAGRGGRPELSGVMPEDSLLQNFESVKFLHHPIHPAKVNYLIWKDAEEEGDSSVAVRRQLVRRGSSPCTGGSYFGKTCRK